MQPMSAESTVSRTYIETILALPWNKSSESEVDLKRAEEILEEDHYGLEKVKDRILEYIAVMKLSGEASKVRPTPVPCRLLRAWARLQLQGRLRELLRQGICENVARRRQRRGRDQRSQKDLYRCYSGQSYVRTPRGGRDEQPGIPRSMRWTRSGQTIRRPGVRAAGGAQILNRTRNLWTPLP